MYKMNHLMVFADVSTPAPIKSFAIFSSCSDEIYLSYNEYSLAYLQHILSGVNISKHQHSFLEFCFLSF